MVRIQCKVIPGWILPRWGSDAINWQSMFDRLRGKHSNRPVSSCVAVLENVLVCGKIHWTRVGGRQSAMKATYSQILHDKFFVLSLQLLYKFGIVSKNFKEYMWYYIKFICIIKLI